VLISAGADSEVALLKVPSPSEDFIESARPNEGEMDARVPMSGDVKPRRSAEGLDLDGSERPDPRRFTHTRL